MDLKALEEAVADKYGGFKGYRECHHAKRNSKVCCRRFWNQHKNKFATGQIAQRLNMVKFIEIDVLTNPDKRKRECVVWVK